ncbi:DUF58 domain-containing protein [Actinospongicola halichondriae]|uniref:DUF58 domain-containing protein n=1 Tax=Actinospongicola halichondriae TaxID=3236844 RepID=UPI003D4E4F29
MSVEPTADRRLGPYVVLAVGGIVAALVTGQATLAACAAPAAVLVVRALADRRPVHVVVEEVEAPVRLLERDEWTLRIRLSWRGDAVLDVIHAGMTGSRVVGAQGWTVTATDGVTIELRSVAERWGRHDLGRVAIRARRPGGMLRWDSTVELDGAVRILPHAAKLDELLAPRRPRVAAGGHVAPVRGSGTDFADLRPYVPGDRLRDLSWTATARSDQPWIVVHHPERTASIMLLLDGFVEVGAPPGSLDRAARVVWSIARHHLTAGDRVGLVSTGSAPTWLSPVSGRRARWQVLDALLTVGAQVAGSRGARSRSSEAPRQLTLPGDAVVLGVSPLQSDAFVASALHHARLGRPTAVVGVETADLLVPTTDVVEHAARRLWTAEVDARMARLARGGVPSVRVVDDAGPAIHLLAGRMSRRSRRTA